MAEESSKTEGPEAGAGADKHAAQLPSFTIYTQYIKDFSFENPNAPGIYMEMKEAPEISVDLDVKVNQLQSTTFEVVLSIEAKAQVGEKSAFVVELKYGGLIGLKDDTTGTQREQILLIEAPRFLFPFARNVISTTTQDGGFPPLLISPIDFVKMYHDRKQRAQSQEGQGGQEEASG